MAPGFGVVEGLMLVFGLALCLAGADVFVRSASRIATRIGISPLTIGLTIVALGTSAPELAVSVRAAAAGEAGIALGNLVGSNITNVWLILGIVALMAPLAIHRQVVRTHIPILIAISSLALALLLDSRLSYFDSILLLVSFAAYLAFLWWETTHRERVELVRESLPASLPSLPQRAAWINPVVACVGLGSLILGAHWVVQASTQLALALGVGSTLVGLTVVAIGTSLPELLTSLVASIRGEREIAVGNIVGSCVFNITCILGISGLVAGGRQLIDPSITHFAMPVMLLSAIGCLPVFFTGHAIARWEGAVFLSAYGAFLVYEILASLHDLASLHLYQAIVRMGIPVITTLLAVSLAREFVHRRQTRSRR